MDAGNKQLERKPVRVITAKLVAVLILLIISIAVFALIADEVVLEREDIFDSKVINFFSEFNNTRLRNVMRVFTFFASTAFLLPAYILLLVTLIAKKLYNYALNVALIAGSSFLLVKGLKLIFHRARPENPFIDEINNYSFPSGHSVSAFVFFSILIYIVWKLSFRKTVTWLLTIFLVLFAFTIGVSRILLGVHYPSDVVAGFSLACAWVIICNFIFSLHTKTRKNQKHGNEIQGDKI